MSEHRYPCMAVPPELIYPQVANASMTHLHECIHDATDHQQLVEHECSCGMTWRAINTRPVPDTSWITYEDVSPLGFWAGIRKAFNWRQP